jgi:hypothetical protein
MLAAPAPPPPTAIQEVPLLAQSDREVPIPIVQSLVLAPSVTRKTRLVAEAAAGRCATVLGIGSWGEGWLKL